MRDAGTPTEVDMWPDPVKPTRGLHETVKMGREIYEREIRHSVEPEHLGKVVAIDVDSGSWALGDDPVITDEEIALTRLREQRPEAVNIYCERVGHKALRSFGWPCRRTD